MALVNGSIPVGATFAPTGGTARTLVDLGGDRSGRKLLVDDTAAFNVRKTVDATVVEPTAGSNLPGGFSPVRRRLSIKKPKVLADGTTFVQQHNIELIIHSETTDSEIDDLLSTGTCLLVDADTSAFWKDSSLS